MAANEQGKFWAMHDRMFANQQKLDRAGLDTLAAEAGLDMARYKAGMDSGKFKPAVEPIALEEVEPYREGTAAEFPDHVLLLIDPVGVPRPRSVHEMDEQRMIIGLQVRRYSPAGHPFACHLQNE